MDAKVIAISDQNNVVKADYVWGPDRVLVKKDKTSEKDYYYLHDAHESVVQMVDTDGNIVNNYRYDEWGNIQNKMETVENPFKYAGEVYDEETGLYYLRARYYNPGQGRFISEDNYEWEMTNPLSLNVYWYCEG